MFHRWMIAATIPVMGLLTGGCESRPAKKSAAAPFTVTVEATYPGASPGVLADTVAAPIEQQVNGVENALHLKSHCGPDGKYTLVATFKAGTDPAIAQVLVQNRATLALPVLPDLVQRGGVTIRKKSPLSMIVNLWSSDARHDAIFLSNYATIHVKDELARLAGVSEAKLLGQCDYSMSIWLDPQKLAARNMTASDVIKAIEQQNGKIAAGKTGQPPESPFQLPIQTMGRLTDPDEFADIIIKAGEGDKADKIRLKDVGRVQMGPGLANSVVLNGKPSVALCIYPIPGARPGEVSRVVQAALALLRTRLPEGLRLEVVADFSPTPESRAGNFLLLDLHLPSGLAADRKGGELQQFARSLQGVAGVQDVLVLSENPFDPIIRQQTCVLVAAAKQKRISPEEITRAIEAIRSRLTKIPDAVLQVRHLARPGFGYPIDLAVSGPEADKVQELAKKLNERLRKSDKLTDVWMNRDSQRVPGLTVEVDMRRAVAQEVSLQDIVSTIEMFSSGKVTMLSSSNKFGRTAQVIVQPGDKSKIDDFKQLQVRNRKGQMIALPNIAEWNATPMMAAINRLDLQPMVHISANPAADVPLANARALCEKLVNEVRQELQLPAEYRLTWLRDLSDK